MTLGIVADFPLWIHLDTILGYLKPLYDQGAFLIGNDGRSRICVYDRPFIGKFGAGSGITPYSTENGVNTQYYGNSNTVSSGNEPMGHWAQVTAVGLSYIFIYLSGVGSQEETQLTNALLNWIIGLSNSNTSTGYWGGASAPLIPGTAVGARIRSWPVIMAGVTIYTPDDTLPRIYTFRGLWHDLDISETCYDSDIVGSQGVYATPEQKIVEALSYARCFGSGKPLRPGVPMEAGFPFGEAMRFYTKSHPIKLIINDHPIAFGFGSQQTIPGPILKPKGSNRYFLIEAGFPLEFFFRQFLQYANETIHFKNDFEMWVVHMHGEGLPNPAQITWGIGNTHVKYAHKCFAYLGYPFDWASEIQQFFNNSWALKSYFDPASWGIRVVNSSSADAMLIPSYTEVINNAQVSLPSFTTPEELVAYPWWKHFAINKGKSAFNPYQPWYVRKGPTLPKEYGLILYDGSAADPSIPSLPDEPSYKAAAWEGANATFWLQVMDTEKEIQTVFANFPLLTQQYLSDALALRTYMIQQQSRIQLQRALKLATTESGWTIQRLLSSPYVIPDNVYLTSELVNWFSIMKPSFVAKVSGNTGLVAQTNLEPLLTDLAAGLSIEDLINKYPTEMGLYGSNFMAVAKFLRTKTFP